MLTSEQKLRQFIIHRATGELCATPDEIVSKWDELDGDDAMQDAQSESRCGQYRTDLPCDSSRHYESRSVASQMWDGSFVGWTYWFGGGKHGEPEAVPWIEEAYDVTMTEETRVVRVFQKAE